jgi:hypothetical protein
MLSPLQQKRVWEGQLASEIRAIYFADLCNHYQRIQRIVTWLTLAFSSGAAATLLADWLPPRFAFLKPTFALATAGLSLWSLVENNHKRATDCSDLQFRYRKLARGFESLWDDMYSPDAQKTLDDLEAKSADLEKSSLAFPEGKRRMTKWQDHVERQHASSVAA